MDDLMAPIELIDQDVIQGTIETLHQTLTEMDESGLKVARLRAEELEAKREEALFKNSLDEVENGAAMEAYGSAKCDGKNQAMRDMQLKAYLAEHKGVVGSRNELTGAQARLDAIGGEIAIAEHSYKIAAARYYAARAELDAHTVLVKLTGGEEL